MSEIRAIRHKDFCWVVKNPADPNWDYLVFDDRWTFDGNVERPTFSPSMLVHGTPGPDGEPHIHRTHCFVRDGRIQYLDDCSHALAGQTIDLPAFTEEEIAIWGDGEEAS